MATPKSKAYMNAVRAELADFTPSGGGKAGSGRGTTGDAGRGSAGPPGVISRTIKAPGFGSKRDKAQLAAANANEAKKARGGRASIRAPKPPIVG